MMFSKKAQASIEFLMIVGVAMTMFLPMLFIFQQFSSQANEKVMVGQINSFGRELISAVDSMYYFGEFSKTTIKFNFPSNIVKMTINTPELDSGDYYEVVVTAFVYGGYTDFVYYTKVPIAPIFTGNCTDDGADYLSDFDGCMDFSPTFFTSDDEAYQSGMKTFKIEAVKNPETKRLAVSIVRILET